MNFFFDTNFYRYLTQDIQLGLINFNELKIAEKEKNYNIYFSNIVATELISHLIDDNDLEQRECLKALKCLYNHTTKEIINNKERFDIVPTFQHILTRYFFNKQSNTNLLNQSIFLFTKMLSSDSLTNLEKEKFINDIIEFKSQERKDLINVLENEFIKNWSKNNKSNWNVLSEKNKSSRKIKKDFNRKIDENYFHDLIAISFYNLAKLDENSITEKTKDNVLKDYENSINFIINHVISKVGVSESLKNYFFVLFFSILKVNNHNINIASFWKLNIFIS